MRTRNRPHRRLCAGFIVVDGFSVDPDAIADAVQRMAEFQRAAEGLLSEIDATVKNLHISWTGEGAAAQSEAHRQWSHGAVMMREALDRLHTAGTGAHGNYTGVMTANQKMWSS
jgi:WXG100 family type VII secretion target